MLYTPPVIAVLYDVHGNLGALDAVLEDARGAGADRWVLGGDYALFGAWPEATLERLNRAIRLGYPKQMVRAEPAFVHFIQDQRFQHLLAASNPP